MDLLPSRKAFEKMAQQWALGVEAFAAVADSSPRAVADQRIHRACQLYFASIANQVEIHMLRDKQDQRTRVRNLIESELRIAEEFLPLCEADPRIGFSLRCSTSICLLMSAKRFYGAVRF